MIETGGIMKTSRRDISRETMIMAFAVAINRKRAKVVLHRAAVVVARSRKKTTTR